MKKVAAMILGFAAVVALLPKQARSAIQRRDG